jgi:protein phosphatase
MIPCAFCFETGAATHSGKVREVNEDGLFSDPERGVWLVADGMGGHQAGRLASSLIVSEVSTIGRAVSAPDLLARFQDRIYRANSELIRLAAQSQAGTIIGSTVAALLIYGQYYACTWSGDSRVYLLRGPNFKQLSRDHTELQELMDSGILSAEEAGQWPRRNVITRAIGIFEEPELDLVQGELMLADTFVLCSDGLTGHVRDTEILATVEQLPPQTACDKLIQMTLDRGASDNVTVMVVRCVDKGSSNPPGTRREYPLTGDAV